MSLTSQSYSLFDLRWKKHRVTFTDLQEGYDWRVTASESNSSGVSAVLLKGVNNSGATISALRLVDLSTGNVLASNNNVPVDSFLLANYDGGNAFRLGQVSSGTLNVSTYHYGPDASAETLSNANVSNTQITLSQAGLNASQVASGRAFISGSNTSAAYTDSQLTGGATLTPSQSVALTGYLPGSRFNSDDNGALLLSALTNSVGNTETHYITRVESNGSVTRSTALPANVERVQVDDAKGVFVQTSADANGVGRAYHVSAQSGQLTEIPRELYARVEAAGGAPVEASFIIGAETVDTIGNSAATTKQWLVGGAGDDILRGGVGADLLVGGSGNDSIIGAGDRSDVIGYSGNRADYTITARTDGITVIDNRTGASSEGADTISNANILQFADGKEFVLAAAQRVALTGAEQVTVDATPVNGVTVNASKIYNGTKLAETFIVSDNVSAMILAGAGDAVQLSGNFADYTYAARGSQLQISRGDYMTTVNIGGVVSIKTANGAANATLSFGGAGPVITLGNQTVGGSTFNASLLGGSSGDTTAPTVISAQSSSPGAVNGILGVGDTLSVSVTLSEAVIVSGRPTLDLNLGGGTVKAAYINGSGTNTLSFAYTILSGQADSSSISLVQNPLSLNSGSITDGAGNPLNGASFNQIALINALVVDITTPSVSSVTYGTNDGQLALGEAVTLSIIFSEAVAVTGTPTLALANGGTATYSAGTGTSTLTFGYTPGPNQSTSDLALAANNALNGTIKDPAGHVLDASNLNGFNPTGTLAVDTVAPNAPTLTLGSGAINSATPTISGTAEANSTVSIYDGSTLLGNAQANGSGAFSFTPSTALTQTAHSITAKATDAAGNVSSASSAISLTVNMVGADTTSPDAPVLITASGIVNNATPTISGTAEANSTVSIYDGSTLLGTTPANGGGAFSFTPSSALMQTTHSITAKATDAAGNVSSVSGSINLAVDTTLPTIALASDKSSLTAGQAATITFTLSEPSTDFTSADVIVAGGALSNFTGSGVNYAATFTPAANSTTAGLVSVASSTFSDAAGNQNADGNDANNRVNLTVNTVAQTASPPGTASPSAPVISGISDDQTPVMGNVANGAVTNDTMPTLTITAAAGGTVRVFDNGALLGTATETATAGTYTFTPGLALWASDTHSFTAKVSDAAGNLSAASSAYAIKVGVTGDGISNGTVTGTTDLTLTLQSRDSHADSGFTLVAGGKFLADNSTATIVYESYGWKLSGTTWATAKKADGVTNDWVTVDSVIPSLPPGAVEFRAKVKVGTTNYFTVGLNPATSGVVLPSVDNTLPATPTISNTDLASASTQPTLTITAEANSTVKVFDGATLLGTATQTATAGAYTFTPASALTNGNHSFYVRAIDAAGNASGFSSAYTVILGRDIVPPQIAISADTSTLSTGQTALITFTLSEASTDFSLSDVVANGGTLSNFTGSGTSYTATFSPTSNTSAVATVSVASNTFSDEAANFNLDGADANNAVSITVDTTKLTVGNLTNTTVAENSAYTSTTPSLVGAVGSVTWSLEGTDANKFTVNAATGVVSMVARDFEAPADSDTNNSYNYTLKATDGEGKTGTKAVSVSVTNVNEVSTLTIGNLADSSVAENAAYTSATPTLSGALGAVTWSLEGEDASRFTVNATTGVVSMVARDYETPLDVGTNNTYNYTLKAADTNGNLAQKAVVVTVSDVVEVSTLTMGNLGNSSVTENSAYTSATPSLTGAIGSVTWSLEGTDANKFTVNAATGVVSMVARDFEAPVDADANNGYSYTLKATDSDGNSVSQSVIVSVANVNEASTLTIGNLADSSVAENAAYTSATPTLSGALGTVTWSLEGEDASRFTVNATTGVVSMVARDYETPLDVGANNTYNYTLKAADTNGNVVQKAVVVTLTNVNEASTLTIGNIADSSVAENSIYMAAAPTITGAIGLVTWSLEGTDAGRFRINAATGVVSMIPRDYEAPVDSDANNSYVYTLRASDTNGNTATTNVVVAVTDVAVENTANAPVGLTVSSFSPVDGGVDIAVDSNLVLSFTKPIVRGVGTIELRRDSATGTLVESFDVGSSNRLFVSASTLTLDPTSTLVSNTNYFLVVPAGALQDVEGNLFAGTSSYDFTTAAADTVAPIVVAFSPANGATSVAPGAPITIDFAEDIIRGVGQIALRSGSATGTLVETYNAATSGLLSLSGHTLTINPTVDLAPGTQYYVVLPAGVIKDAAGNAYAGSSTYTFTSSAAITISAINDDVGTTQGNVVNGSTTDDTTPTLTGALSSALAAGQSVRILHNGAYYDTATVTGANWSYTPSARLVAGSHVFSVAVVDASGNTLAASDARSFNMPLSIDGLSSQSLPENTAYTSATPTVSGAVGSVRWMLEGEDAARFDVNASTGVVTMAARNYEAPADVGANNTYGYTLKATDAAGQAATQAVVVSITDVTTGDNTPPQGVILVAGQAQAGQTLSAKGYSAWNSYLPASGQVLISSVGSVADIDLSKSTFLLEGYNIGTTTDTGGLAAVAHVASSTATSVTFWVVGYDTKATPVKSKYVQVTLTNKSGGGVYAAYTSPNGFGYGDYGDLTNSTSFSTSYVSMYSLATSDTASGIGVRSMNLYGWPNVTDADGVGAYSYQWYADGQAISGATASSYTLTTNEVGKSVNVKLSYTDGAGKLETIAAASQVVTSPSTVLLGPNQLLSGNSANALSTTSGTSAGSILGATSDEGVVVYERTAGSTKSLLAVDTWTGTQQIINRGISSSTDVSSGVSEYKAISANGRYVVFSSSDVSSFGNNGVAFTDANASSTGVSDLFVYDRNTSSTKLVTWGGNQNQSTSSQASFVGMTADNQYIIYRTDYVNKVGSFSRSGIPDTTASSDLVAYKLSDGSQTLLTHSATANQSLGSGVGNTVMLTNDGQYVLFTANNATLLGNNGAAFRDDYHNTADLFAVCISDGSIRLLNHTAGQTLVSPGGAVRLYGQTGDGAYAIFGSASASQYGMTDGNAASSDLFAVNIGTGVVTVLNHVAGTRTTTASSQPTFVKAIGDYVYYTVNDARTQGASADGDVTKADLYRINVATGDLQLLSFVSNNSTAAMNGNYVADSLVVSADNRYVAFSSTITGSPASGDAVFVVDTQLNTIAQVQANGSYTLWGGAKPIAFADNAHSLVFSSRYGGFYSGFSSSNDYDTALMSYSLSTGNLSLLSHSAVAGNKASSSSATYKGMSADGKTVYFTAPDATKFGNAGTAFTDSATTTEDLFAVDVTTGAIQLVSGLNGASLGTAISFEGVTGNGQVLFRTANTNNLPVSGSASGVINDASTTATDLVASGFALLDLVSTTDTAGGVEGSNADNVTSAHALSLRGHVQPNQQVTLLDNGLIVAGGAVTADSSGYVNWALSNVATGSHAYSLIDSASKNTLTLSGRTQGASLVVNVVADTTAPSLLAGNPLSLSNSLSSDITLHFSENVQAGVGVISFYTKDNSTTPLFSVDVRSSAVTFSGGNVVINPPDDLLGGKDYFIHIDNTAIFDQSGNAFRGVADDLTLRFGTVDNAAPLFNSPNTATVFDNNTKIYSAHAVDAIRATDGNINYSLKSGSGDVGLLNIDANNGFVTLKAGATSAAAKGQYHFTVVATDASGNAQEQSVTVNVDLSPTLTGSNPADNAINVAVGSDIVLTFSEAVSRGTGVVSLYKTDGTLVESFDAVTSSALTYAGTQLTINPTASLAANTQYYLQISPTAVIDSIGNNYAGTQSVAEVSFSTGAADTTAPVLAGSSPADNMIGMDIGANITLTFSEVIARGAGTIRIYKADGALVESYNAATSPNLSISGKTLTINPTWDLESSASLYLKMDAGSLVDASGNPFGGINDTTTLNFTTGTETFNVAGAASMIDNFPGTSSESIGSHTALYIRVTFSNEVTEPMLLDQVNLDMNETARFFQENSYGKMTVATVYTPVIVIPYARDWMWDNKRNDYWPLAKELARSLGYDSNSYEVTVVMSYGSGDGVSWGGGSDVEVGWGGMDTVAHEIGHALARGMGHANNLVTFAAGENNYGNPFDIMGQGISMDSQIGAQFKMSQEGWLPTDMGNHNPQDVSGGVYSPSNGLYRIYALDGRNYQTERKYGLSYAGTQGYDLEYRDTIGLLENSVLVTVNNKSTIIDATPGSTPGTQPGDTASFADAGITLGKTFNLPGTDIYVSVVSKGDGYMDVASYQGPFTNNVSPTASFTVSSGKLVTNQAINFSANAADANGDALLYCWEFGDGVIGTGANYSREVYDAALTSLTVKLTVSDMHGGTVVNTYTLQTTNAASPVTVGSVGAVNAPSTPQVSVVATDAFATEGGDTGAFLFTRQGGNISQDLVIKLNYDPRLAQPTGVTYDTTQAGFVDLAADVSSNSHPTTITIPAGQTSATLIITPTDDAIREGLEQMVVSISSDAAYTVSSNNASARVTVYDNDTPVVSIKTIDGVATEGTRDSGTVLVTRTGSLSEAMCVYYTVSGTAYNGSDYGLLRGQALIPAGETSVVISVMPVDDGIGEIDESVVIALTNFNNTYDVGASSNAEVVIHDNLDKPRVSVTYSEQQEEFSSPAFIFRGVSSREGSVTVNYTISGTATSGVDFVPFSGTLTLPIHGVNDVSVPLKVIADTIPENVESVVLTITPSDEFTIGDEAIATARIFDETNLQRVGVTSQPIVPVSTGPNSYGEFSFPAEGGPTGAFYIYRAGTDTSSALTVSYTLSGTATAGTDYTGALTSGTAIIPAGASGVSVGFTPVDDGSAEGTETVTIRLNGGTGYSLDYASQATQKIVDNDASAITVGFATCGTSVQEIDGLPRQVLDIKVKLTAPATSACSVSYEAGGGTATGNQVDWGYLDAAGNPMTRGTLNFAVGEQEKTIRVVVNNDRVRESVEIAKLKLVDPAGMSITTNKDIFELDIYDQFPDVVVTEQRWAGSSAFTNNVWDPNTAVYQGRSSFTTVTNVGDDYSRRLTGVITAPETGDYTFYLSADDQARLYLSTDATAGNKTQIATVTSSTGYNVWDAQASQKSITISLVAGQTYYLEVQHLEASGSDYASVAWEGPSFARKQLMSQDVGDTGNRYVRWLTTANTVSETEGADPMMLLVLDRPAGDKPITVTLAIQDGTAVEGSDYVLSNTTVTFQPGEQSKSVPLSVLTDSVGEAPESLKIAMMSASGAIVQGDHVYQLAITDGAPPAVQMGYGSVVSTDLQNAMVAHVTAVPVSGRTISGWSILAGNPTVAGQANPAFAIDATGNVTLLNPASLPLGQDSVKLVVRATDSQGAASDTHVVIVVNGMPGLIEQLWANPSTVSEVPDYTAAPIYTGVLQAADASRDLPDPYLRRLTGELKPATSGAYTFWIAGNDAGTLYLGTNASESSKVEIASSVSYPDIHISGFVGYQQWDKYPSQKSVTINLQAGQHYWFEVQQIDMGGADHVSVAWEGPGISRQVIPGSAFASVLPGEFDDLQPLTATYADHVNTATISTTMGTDAGLTATINSGSITRDNTLLVSGTADAGATVEVLSGTTCVGKTVAQANGQWQLTTAALKEGQQNLTARMTDAFGNIATTSAVVVTVHTWLSQNDNALISSDETSLPAADGNVTAVKFTANQGLVALGITDASRYGNNDVAFSDAAPTAGDVIVVNPVTGATELITKGTASGVSAGVATTLGGISGDGRYVVFGTSNAAAFGNAARFTDTRADSGSPYSDLIVYDRTNATMSLVTHKAADLNSTSNYSTNFAGISADSKYILFSQNSLGDLGYNFTNSGGTTELVAYTIGTGDLRVLSHSSSGLLAASQADITNIRLTSDGKYALFTANDATKLGNKISGTAYTFSDSATSTADLFSVNLDNGEVRLLSNNTASATSTASVMTSAAIACNYVGQSADGSTVYMSTSNASSMGLSGGAGANLVAVNLDTGAKTLVAALGGESISEGLLISTNQRYEAFVTNMNFGVAASHVSGWTAADNGGALVVYDTVNHNYAMVNHVANNPNYAGYLTWGSSKAIGFTADSNTLVFETAQIPEFGAFTVNNNDSDYVRGLLAYDVSTGTQRLLTHSAESTNKQLTATTTTQGMTADGKWVLWTADDASKFGNNGLAFSDSNPTGADLFATNIETGVIRLLSGVNGVSSGGASVFSSISSDGNTAYFTNTNISGLKTGINGFADGDINGSDLVSVRLNLLDLATASDTSGGAAGTAYDNITGSHSLTLNALIEPYQQALLFDGATQLGAATTADQAGNVSWVLGNVQTGMHDYSIYNPTEMVPYRLDNNLASSHLNVQVV